MVQAPSYVVNVQKNLGGPDSNHRNFFLKISAENYEKQWGPPLETILQHTRTTQYEIVWDTQNRLLYVESFPESVLLNTSEYNEENKAH